MGKDLYTIRTSLRKNGKELTRAEAEIFGIRQKHNTGGTNLSRTFYLRFDKKYFMMFKFGSQVGFEKFGNIPTKESKDNE